MRPTRTLSRIEFFRSSSFLPERLALAALMSALGLDASPFLMGGDCIDFLPFLTGLSFSAEAKPTDFPFLAGVAFSTEPKPTGFVFLAGLAFSAKSNPTVFCLRLG